MSGWMLDFQIPRWRLLMQARNGHTPVDLGASTTISLHMGAEVAEAMVKLHLVARSEDVVGHHTLDILTYRRMITSMV